MYFDTKIMKILKSGSIWLLNTLIDSLVIQFITNTRSIKCVTVNKYFSPDLSHFFIGQYDGKKSYVDHRV